MKLYQIMWRMNLKACGRNRNEAVSNNVEDEFKSLQEESK